MTPSMIPNMISEEIPNMTPNKIPNMTPRRAILTILSLGYYLGVSNYHIGPGLYISLPAGVLLST